MSLHILNREEDEAWKADRILARMERNDGIKICRACGTQCGADGFHRIETFSLLLFQWMLPNVRFRLQPVDLLRRNIIVPHGSKVSIICSRASKLAGLSEIRL